MILLEKKQFKAESKKLLDLMINSIYTHKEIFLRELISNASDAIDKLYFRSLTDETVGLNKDDFEIRIDLNEGDRVFKISDNGIGMTADELENNLGTIAQSGSQAFKKENTEAEDIEIIGQFGVGFYSAFMVSDKIVVETRISHLGQKSFTLQQRAVNEETGEIHCECRTVMVCFSLKEQVSADIPEEFRKAIEEFEKF